MNKLFVISSLLSILFGFLFHRNMVLTDAILQLPSHVLELSVTLVVNGCFWNGFCLWLKLQDW